MHSATLYYMFNSVWWAIVTECALKVEHRNWYLAVVWTYEQNSSLRILLSTKKL